MGLDDQEFQTLDWLGRGWEAGVLGAGGRPAQAYVKNGRRHLKLRV